MIERFNFFDVYGYLLPGALLLGLGYLPVGIVAGIWPPAEIELALIGGIAAYVVGHLLHMAHRYVFAVKEKQPKGPPRDWSDLLLDHENQVFSPTFKEQLAVEIKNRFGLDVTSGAGAAGTDLGQRRFEAFQLCRRSLIQEKAVSYAEQFQGLYELRRGVAAATLAAMFFYFGWALASLSWLLGSESGALAAGAAVVAVAGLLSLRQPPKGSGPRALLWYLATILLGVGFIAGVCLGIERWQGLLLSGLGLLLGWFGWHFRGAYRTFAREFAATVYRDFVVLATAPRPAKAGD